MKIVHVLNYQFNKSGQSFANPDQKLQHGLIENGHYVYGFPFNDICRQMTFTSSKKLGVTAASKSLIQTCQHINPDLLLLGHSQLLPINTLEKLKTKHPHMRIAQWFCDALYERRNFEFLFDRLPFLNALFCTTAGEPLEQFRTDTCNVHYLPNPVHSALENGTAFANKNHDYDLVFIGSDRHAPERQTFLKELQALLPSHIRFGIFGSLGNPGIHGREKDQLLLKTRAALNLTRYEPQRFYSSDRIAQMMGNGLLVCTHAGAALDELYGRNSLLTYNSAEELSHSLSSCLATNEWRTRAETGWKISHTSFSAKMVTKEMLNKLFS